MAKRIRSGAVTTISDVVIQLLPANAERLCLIVQETGGTNDFTFGDDADNVADGFGIHVPAKSTIILDANACPTGAIWAHFTTSGDATGVAHEIVP